MQDLSQLFQAFEGNPLCRFKCSFRFLAGIASFAKAARVIRCDDFCSIQVFVVHKSLRVAPFLLLMPSIGMCGGGESENDALEAQISYCG
jgi:hypothetical protein